MDVCQSVINRINSTRILYVINYHSAPRGLKLILK